MLGVQKQASEETNTKTKDVFFQPPVSLYLPVVHLTTECLVAKPLNRSEAKLTLLWYKPCCLSNAAGLITNTLLSCELDIGLYHNMVNFSLTPNQRLGDQVHNCKLAYCHNVLMINNLLITWVKSEIQKLRSLTRKIHSIKSLASACTHETTKLGMINHMLIFSW